MANNSSTPYFNRFADLAVNDKSIQLSFICLFPTKPQMIDDMSKRGLKCFWIKFSNTKRKINYLQAIIKGNQLLRQIKPDIIHTHLFDDSVPMLIAAKLAGIKHRVISKLDAGFHYYYNRKWVWLDKLNNALATNIVCVSSENKDFVINKEKANKKKIHLIHQGISEEEVTKFSKEDIDYINKEFNLLNNEKIILSVSRFIEWKGQKFILEAANKILMENTECKFILLGAGDFRLTLQKWVEKKNLSRKIIIHEPINRSRLNALYSLSNIFVHAALLEPFGFVIAEAMLNKIPIITTNTGAAKDALEHKKSAFISKKKDNQSIYEGIKYMLNNNTKNLTDKAYQNAKELFSIEKMWERHLNLYKTIVNTKG